MLGVKTCHAARTCCAGRACSRSQPQSVRGPGPGRRYGMQGLARWLHALQWRTWQCLVWPPTRGGALLWRHMHIKGLYQITHAHVTHKQKGLYTHTHTHTCNRLWPRTYNGCVCISVCVCNCNTEDTKLNTEDTLLKLLTADVYIIVQNLPTRTFSIYPQTLFTGCNDT